LTNDLLFRSVLARLSNGVMTIGVDGRILTFNAAAEAILGLGADDVLGKSLAEAFLQRDENDQFNQSILNAVYDADVIHNKVVAWQRDGQELTLEMNTSFLTDRETGIERKTAVIVVFQDITEVEGLRGAERRLTEELQTQHQALQKSYLELEEANDRQRGLLRKVQVIRVAVTVFVILLFIVGGLFTWRQGGALQRPPAGLPREEAAAARVFTAVPQTLTDSIALKGKLKPIQIFDVASPFAGTIQEKHYEYGQTVTRGQLLLKLDRADTEMKYREARTACIEAEEKLRELEHWGEGNEMLKAQQNVTRSKLALDGHHKTFQETERLFRKEIVPETEYANAKQQYTTARLDYDSALRDLAATREKGEGQNREIARLKLENARQKMKSLDAQMGLADVYAPVSGTILLPDASGDKDKKSRSIELGGSVGQGDILLSIGNTETISMTAEVDELEVLKIKKGQKVRITIDAVGETLEGMVAHVSSQAVKSQEEKRALASIPEALRGRLRLGMSAKMEILVLNKPGALMAPIQAVSQEGTNRFVTLRGKGAGAAVKQRVETGITTLDAVEITAGLKAGDEVIY